MKINEKGGMDESCHDKECTTTFVDAGNVVRGDFDRRVLSDDIVAKHQSIIDFMAKPYLIDTLSWTTASTQNTLLSAGYPVSTYLAGVAAWQNKLQGFSLIRGKACLRVQINSNPFQQGRLLLHFLPCEQDFSGVNNTMFKMHNSAISSKRQQPCIEIDCNDAVGTMEMPYITPSNWYDLTTNKYDWGTFYISVLSQLATGSAGETAVDVTVYLYFEDVELAAPLVPQSSGKGPKTKFKAKTYSRKDVSSREADAMQERPLSSALKTVSVAAGILGNIPTLAPIAEPASWALDVAAGVASYLGWSKPVNNIQPKVVSAQYNRYMATSDGVDNGVPLGLRSDNKLSITDGLSVYDADEMSFGFLKKVSSVFKTVSWTTSQTSNTSLYSAAVSPYIMTERYTYTNGGHSVVADHGNPIGYLAPSFALWRGGVEVTIKIVKTDFHTGRLQLTFSPGTFSSYTAPDTTTGYYALREILDIREGGVYTFMLPYLLQNHYQATNKESGRLDICVLNELRCPETCSSAVDILIYYNGADDFEFQAPGYQVSQGSRISLPFVPQTADEEECDHPVGDCVMVSESTRFAEAACGEMFMSIKQLLGRNSLSYFNSSIPSSTGKNSIAVWPWYAGAIYLPGTGLLAGPNLGADIFSILLPMYAFFRGGSNLTVNLDTTTTVPITSTIVQYDPVSDSQNVVVGGIDVMGKPQVTIWTNGDSAAGLQGFHLADKGVGFVTVRAPYYARTKCSLAIPQTTSNHVTPHSSEPWTTVNMEGASAFNNYMLMRSFPDDFQFSYFIGCPPRFVSYT